MPRSVFLLLALVAPARADGLGAARWHAAGHTGRGVRVVVLDTGFHGYRDHLGKHLPAKVETKSFRFDGDIEAGRSHGLACAAVIHALAPAAELVLVNWEPDRPTSFLAAVRWALEHGAKVLSCSVVVPGWGDGQGGGPVNAALTKILDTPSRPIFVAAAGNLAERHWGGEFRGTGRQHEWRPGESGNRLTPWPGADVAVDLAAPVGSTYRVRLMDGAGREAARPFAAPGGGLSVRLQPVAGERYALRVEHVAGPAEPFRVTVVGAALEHSRAAGSLAFPAENARAFAIGAVDGTGRRLSYSGFPVVAVAPVPVPVGVRRDPFSGTSAAAPQVAGLAALVRGRYPDWSAERVESYLRERAKDVGETGPDAETGAGVVRLD
jgi:subtilisin family serine protease